MKPSVLDEVQQLRSHVGSGQAGKFIQRLLALALIKAGISVVDERTVEGPDLDLGEYQVEVKTAEREPFQLTQKDFNDVAAAAKLGKAPAFAFLSLDSFDGWVFALAERISQNSVYCGDLALCRIRSLEEAANANFDDVVKAWAHVLRDDPDGGFERMDLRRREGVWKP
ncbi:MAG: hypothetical protein ABIE42_10715 [Candidatus Eisenbacteria bacterium]